MGHLQAGSRPAAYHPAMSATIEDVRARAMHLFRTEEGASAFLNLHCRALGGVPAELAAHGGADQVLTFLFELEHAAPPDPLEDHVPGSHPF